MKFTIRRRIGFMHAFTKAGRSWTWMAHRALNSEGRMMHYSHLGKDVDWAWVPVNTSGGGSGFYCFGTMREAQQKLEAVKSLEKFDKYEYKIVEVLG